MANRLDPYKNSIDHLGLDLEALERHAALLTAAVETGAKPTFPVLDTCRLDNTGVLPEQSQGGAQGSSWAAGYAAFVPAAGAASRYSQPLFALSEALAKGDTAAATAGLKALSKEGATSWPLPPLLAELVAHPERVTSLSQAQLASLSHDLHLPKALMPCVREGTSFLAMKHLEHSQMPGLSGQVFIAPPAMQEAFAEHLRTELKSEHAAAKALETGYLEQGPKLSTVRFQRGGEPVVDAHGELSPVPAGHGSLTQLFPAAKALCPQADALFIRNIDNVMGTAPEVLAATEHFLSLHRRLLTAVQQIRAALAQEHVDAAGAVATQLLSALQISSEEQEAAVNRAGFPLPSGAEGQLWQVQLSLFHARLTAAPTRQRLVELYDRPVNLMGQVPNTQHDVGGTPCFISLPGPTAASQRGKVCLEVPHASAADKQEKLANPKLATHFNPGFCAVEVTADPLYYAKRNRDFWLMAEKTFRGQAVVYYETVLYELIGHSDFANTVFVEVPRRVFNPHKTLRDALDRTLASWIGTK